MGTKSVPLQAWKERLREFEGPRNFRQSAHEGGKMVSPRHWSPIPPLRTQEILLLLISVRGWVDPNATERPEVLSK